MSGSLINGEKVQGCGASGQLNSEVNNGVSTGERWICHRQMLYKGFPTALLTHNLFKVNFITRSVVLQFFACHLKRFRNMIGNRIGNMHNVRIE